MWTYEHSQTTTATPRQIWPLYADVAAWLRWDRGLTSVTLEGPFAAGSSGMLTPAGQDGLPFTIVDATPNKEFTDETAIPGAVLRFIHRLDPVEGGTRVTHRLEIDGPAADEIGPNLGPMITADFADAVEALVALAERAPAAAANGR
jgi:hypothetical protein